jgi:hypothetical protein
VYIIIIIICQPVWAVSLVEQQQGHHRYRSTSQVHERLYIKFQTLQHIFGYMCLAKATCGGLLHCREHNACLPGSSFVGGPGQRSLSVERSLRSLNRNPPKTSLRTGDRPQNGGPLNPGHTQGISGKNVLESAFLVHKNALFKYKHTRSHCIFSSTQQVHSQQHSKNPHGHDRYRQAKHGRRHTN